MGELGRGLWFGLLLQLSVGPVCLFVFQTGSSAGLGAALGAVAGVTLVDAAFLLVALGTKATFLSRPEVQGWARVVASVVLGIFGLDLVAGTLGLGFLPRWSAGAGWGGPFVSALVLTASNPLTIVFWMAVLTSRAGDKPAVFGVGALIPTPLFLGGVGWLGTVTASLASPLLGVLNAVVGVAFLGFALVPLVWRRGPQG